MASVRNSGSLSAWAYFGCVALVTALGIALAMQLRPGFAHTVREFVGLEKEPRANPDSFYVLRVAPLFETRCVGCHGAGRQKAELRLDSFGAVMRGGRHGAVIQPGRIKDSELFTRISLPSSDDRAMPPSGKAPLTPDEVTVIKLWIAAGASGSQRVIAGAPKPVVEVKLPEFDTRAVEKQRAPLAAAVKQLQARFPGVIDYQSRSSADLEINASRKAGAFGDGEIQALAPVRSRIVRADFSNTAISDASAPAIAAMTSLRALRLTNTKVSDRTMEALGAMKTLRSVAAGGTGATGTALAALRKKGVTVYGGDDAQ